MSMHAIQVLEEQACQRVRIMHIQHHAPALAQTWCL